MKKLIYIIVILFSVQSFGQTWKLYGERKNTDLSIDSFFTKNPFFDSVFNQAGNFVSLSVEVTNQMNLEIPSMFANYHRGADGIYRNYVPRANAVDATTIGTNLLAANNPASNSLPVFNSSGGVILRTEAQIRSDLLIDQVNNTSDANKPVSVATQTALNNKTTYYTGQDAGANDSYVVTISPVPPSLTAGMIVIFRANTANTTGCTINVNGLGVVNIVKRVSTTPATGDILAQMYCMLIYNGTNFVLLNPVVN